MLSALNGRTAANTIELSGMAVAAAEIRPSS